MTEYCDNLTRKIGYHALRMIEALNKRKVPAYFSIVHELLAGVSSDSTYPFRNIQGFGKVPELSEDHLQHVMDGLVANDDISLCETEWEETYYVYLPNTVREDREKIMQLISFKDNNAIEYVNDILDGYDSTRDPVDSEAYSVKGILDEESVSLLAHELKYESALERDFLRHILDIGFAKHIVVQPLDIPYGKTGKKTYTPDMIVLTHKNHVVLVEIKDVSEMTTYSVLKKYAVLKNDAEEQDFGYAMIGRYEDRWISLETIRNRPTNLHLESFVMNRIDRDEIMTNDEYEAFKGQYDYEDIDLMHIILKHNLVKKSRWDYYDITRRPFVIASSTDTSESGEDA